jgi:adenine-specific DNA-methyltransferase
MIEGGLEILVGDANGADKAVQRFFSDRHYFKVQVFCMAGRCRNNVGNWPVEEVTAPKGARGAEFYTVKDRVMTERASCGLMLWDGRSPGTLNNVIRLVEEKKPVVVYRAESSECVTLKKRDDLKAFLERHGPEIVKESPVGTASTLF